MMMGSRFKAGPLSIAVPEGAFNKWVDEEVTRVQSRRQAGQPGTSSGASFNWPKLNALTINDLTSKGREWVDFLGLKSGLQNSYGVTRNTLDIRKRIDENAARYIVSCAGLAKPRETFFFISDDDDALCVPSTSRAPAGELHQEHDGPGLLLAVSCHPFEPHPPAYSPPAPLTRTFASPL